MARVSQNDGIDLLSTADTPSGAGAPNGQPIGQATLRRLRLWLAEGHVATGGRLPPERALAGMLDIGRSDLRKALAILEAEGRVSRHVGRGTYLCAVPTLALAQSAIDHIAHRTSPHEAMIARLTLEPQLAHHAALHARPVQIDRARRLAAEARQATTWARYEELDFALHDTIAEASGNPLLHELHRILNTVRQTVVWPQLSPGRTGPAPDYRSFDEHDAIVDAIARRDRAGAHDAMRAHLDATLDAMTASATTKAP